MTINSLRGITLGKGKSFVPQWPPDQVMSPEWTEVEWRAFRDASGKFFGGTWKGEPGALRLEPYPYDEVCIMLSGKVALVDAEGRRREFVGGDAFFVPAGFRGVWETIEPSSKIFVGFDPSGRSDLGP